MKKKEQTFVIKAEKGREGIEKIEVAKKRMIARVIVIKFK